MFLLGMAAFTDFASAAETVVWINLGLIAVMAALTAAMTRSTATPAPALAPVAAEATA